MFSISHPMFETITQWIGILTLITILTLIAIKLLAFVWHLCTRRRAEWCGGPNTWAVITGSTDGIGLSYAKQLAEKGYNLLLISRTESKLNKIKVEIQSKYDNCLVRVLAIDFTRNDIYQQIANELKSLDEIHVLVNNVGITYPNTCPEYFTQIPDLDNFIDASINVNIIACTRLIALVLPRMEAKGRGIIINMSSFTAKFPSPLLAIYSATKIYVDYLSRALNEEYKPKGIIIQSVLPFYVSTKMTKNIRKNFFIPSPDQYVRSALKTVGIESQTSGYLSHKWISWNQDFGSHLFGINFFIKLGFNHFREIRRRIYTNEDLNKINLKLFISTKD